MNASEAFQHNHVIVCLPCVHTTQITIKENNTCGELQYPPHWFLPNPRNNGNATPILQGSRKSMCKDLQFSAHRIFICLRVTTQPMPFCLLAAFLLGSIFEALSYLTC